MTDSQTAVTTSPEQTLDLIRKAQAGDLAARNRIVLDNMRLVTKRAAQAARRCGKSEHLQDIINTAVAGASDNDGLIHAIEKFDVTRGLRFSTYAVRWIDNAIQNALTQTSTVRLGRNSHGEARLRNVVAELTSEDDCAPTPREVRARCVFRGASAPSDKAIERALVTMREEELPGEAPANDQRKSSTSHDLRAFTADPNPETAIEERQEWKLLCTLLPSLPWNEQLVIRHTFGLAGHEILERTDIATQLGVSTQRVGHLQTSALKRLQALTAGDGKSRNHDRGFIRPKAA
jgi:RNA polymerase sigma factor (sigma-70 family)